MKRLPPAIWDVFYIIWDLKTHFTDFIHQITRDKDMIKLSINISYPIYSSKNIEHILHSSKYIWLCIFLIVIMF